MEISNLWKNLVESKFQNINNDFLDSFRMPGSANNCLAVWDPFDPTMRFFKFLLLNGCNSKSNSFFIKYNKLGDVNLGSPIFITIEREDLGVVSEINMDHFFSVGEFEFLEASLPLESCQNILEIGAGFGRTCQGLIKLSNSIKSYTIIDLPEMLNLSSAYLKKVLSDEEFKKVEFISAENIGSIKNKDLVINIDSFQEMPRKTIECYMEQIVSKAKYFYSKNPIGKYSPESIGLKSDISKPMPEVFSLGLSTQLIDIFNERELRQARKQHIESFKPSKFFVVLHDCPMDIFSYYHHVIYKNVNTDIL
ncbi:sugar O-methyltransferase domain protein [Leptospira weilii serovar Ranarum str. ICFT]|uniref:Sugar O-methyltransferase domain protein n=1 Tax=Leptospira weilii serovar Ranarum str. ICFT TaxID=1218598 RepID=N1WBS9_9LEPT|nr:putative sugar O-methyltransferase [Leptospira weilii]EMY76375.1 sugar O-methyltransferase domain protein [Leptospira weilii serovar Ranarum str. ICFT]